jgi:hypothetical protein
MLQSRLYRLTKIGLVGNALAAPVKVREPAIALYRLTKIGLVGDAVPQINIIAIAITPNGSTD